MSDSPNTYAELVAAYPELATTSADEQTTIGTLLGVANQQCRRTMYADAETWRLARLALGAHFVKVLLHRTLKHGGGGIGAVAGRTFEDGSTVSYTQIQGSMDESALLTTAYGALYVTLHRGSLARLPMIV